MSYNPYVQGQQQYMNNQQNGGANPQQQQYMPATQQATPNAGQGTVVYDATAADYQQLLLGAGVDINTSSASFDMGGGFKTLKLLRNNIPTFNFDRGKGATAVQEDFPTADYAGVYTNHPAGISLDANTVHQHPQALVLLAFANATGDGNAMSRRMYLGDYQSSYEGFACFSRDGVKPEPWGLFADPNTNPSMSCRDCPNRKVDTARANQGHIHQAMASRVPNYIGAVPTCGLRYTAIAAPLKANPTRDDLFVLDLSASAWIGNENDPNLWGMASVIKEGFKVGDEQYVPYFSVPLSMRFIPTSSSMRPAFSVLSGYKNTGEKMLAVMPPAILTKYRDLTSAAQEMLNNAGDPPAGFGSPDMQAAAAQQATNPMGGQFNGQPQGNFGAPAQQGFQPQGYQQQGFAQAPAQGGGAPAAGVLPATGDDNGVPQQGFAQPQAQNPTVAAAPQGGFQPQQVPDGQPQVGHQGGFQPQGFAPQGGQQLQGSAHSVQPQHGFTPQGGQQGGFQPQAPAGGVADQSSTQPTQGATQAPQDFSQAFGAAIQGFKQG